MEFNHRASEFKHERSSNVGEWFDGKTRGFKMWYDRELSYSDDVTGMDGDGGFGEGEVV